MFKWLLVIAFFVLVASATLCWRNYKFRPLGAGVTVDRILVEKSARRLTLFDGTTVLKTYRVSLGRSPIGTKQEEGDCRTPEGIYSIDGRKADSDFHRALHISYPNENDSTSALRRGVPPGGDIMIHGLPNGGGWMGAMHLRKDWTAGCVAVTDSEIEEIWRAVPDGTPIEIRP